MTNHESVIDEIVKSPDKYLGLSGLISHNVIFTKPLYNSTVSLIDMVFKTEKLRIYVKSLIVDDGYEQYKDQQVIQEFEILSNVYQLFKDHERYMTPEPLALFREKKTIVTRECQGESYYNYIFNNSHVYKTLFTKRAIEQSIWDSGKWLRIFHDNMTVLGEKDLILERIIQYSIERIRILSSSKNACFASGFAVKLSNLIDRVAGTVSLKASDVAFQHNDFSLVNMLYDGQRITVLDFTSSELGTIYNDLSRFWDTLECIKNASWQKRNLFGHLQKIFFSGYGASVETSSPLFVLCRIKYVLANILSMHRAINKRNGSLGLMESYWYSRYYKSELDWLNKIVEKGESF